MANGSVTLAKGLSMPDLIRTANVRGLIIASNYRVRELTAQKDFRERISGVTEGSKDVIDNVFYSKDIWTGNLAISPGKGEKFGRYLDWTCDITKTRYSIKIPEPLRGERAVATVKHEFVDNGPSFDVDETRSGLNAIEISDKAKIYYMPYPENLHCLWLLINESGLWEYVEKPEHTYKTSKLKIAPSSHHYARPSKESDKEADYVYLPPHKFISLVERVLWAPARQEALIPEPTYREVSFGSDPDFRRMAVLLDPKGEN